MRSDRKQTPNSDVQHVQTDAEHIPPNSSIEEIRTEMSDADGHDPHRAQKAHNRSHVRSLLGIPERESSHLTFSPILPPVGFTYAHHRFPEEPYLTAQSPASEPIPSALESEPQVEVEAPDLPEKVPSSAPIEKASPEFAGPPEKSQVRAPKNEPGGSSGGIADVSESVDIERASSPEPASVKSMEAFNEASDSVQAVSTEIPGVSHMREPFPVLSPDQHHDTPSHKAGTESQRGPVISAIETAATSGETEAESQAEERPMVSEDETQAAQNDDTLSRQAGAESQRGPVVPPMETLTTADTAGAESQAEERSIASENDTQHRIQQEPKFEQAIVKPTAVSEQPDGRIAQVRIDIPGASDVPRDFPALSPDKEDGALLNKAEAAPRPTTFPAEAQVDAVRESQLEVQSDARAIHPMRETTERPKARLAGTPGRLGNLGTPDDVSTTNREAQIARTYRFYQRMGPLPDSAQEKSRIGPDLPFNVGKDTVNASNSTAAERIEQLRRLVHELTAKVSSMQAKMNDGTQQQHASPERQQSTLEQTPYPPTQSVVIIKRPPNQARNPRAFWERSYVSRFRRNPLR